MTTAAPPDLHLDDDLVTEFAQAPLVYLIAGPPRLGRRFVQLLIGAIALVVSAGWWVAIVELAPASARPYIGGSQNNSVPDLILGYNGFGRLTGNETGSVGGGGQGTGRWGATGWYRMFNSQFGSQVSWLIPASLLLLASGLIATGRAPRTDRTRAALILWGGWLLVTDVVLSFGRGIIHPYYTVALGPAIGAVVTIGATYCWARRSSVLHRVVLALAIAGSAWWSYVLLTRTPNWNPWVRYAVLVVGTVAAVVLVAWKTIGRRAAIVVVGSALASMLAAPFAYSVATAATAKSGVIPSAGPTVAGGFGGAPPRSSRYFRPTPGTTPGWRRPSEPIRPPASRSVPVTL